MKTYLLILKIFLILTVFMNVNDKFEYYFLRKFIYF